MRGCTPPVYAAPDPVNQPSLVHDLRNLLASIGLHVETLQRLSGPGGGKAADAAYALLVRGIENFHLYEWTKKTIDTLPRRQNTPSLLGFMSGARRITRRIKRTR